MKVKKLGCLSMAAVLSLGVVGATACGKKKAPDTAETLEIFCLESGYGIEWLDDTIQLFKNEAWVQEKYPNLVISTKKSALPDAAFNYMNNGEKLNTIDLLFDTTSSASFFGPSGQVVDLTEVVYNTEVPGEAGVLIKDKMNATNLELQRYKGTDVTEDIWYTFPWQNNVNGVIYNETKLQAAGKEVPRTTDEFIALVSHFADPTAQNGPIATWGVSTYWDYVYDVLWAQYAGTEKITEFWQGIANNTENNVDIFAQPAREKAIEVVYDLLSKKENVWMCQTTDRSNFIETQTRLLQGQAVFMANGAWFNNEMAGVIKNLENAGAKCDTVKMMMTPVLSSIVEKLNYSAMTDAELSAVVKAIDEGKSYADISASYSADFTEDDFNIILDARMTVGGGCSSSFAYIPTYAKGKDVAIDFLRFLSTDKANKAYVAATQGAPSVFDYDVVSDTELYNACSDFSKSIFEILNHPYKAKITYATTPQLYPLYLSGGVRAVKTLNTSTIGQACTERGANGNLLYNSANAVYQACINYWTADGNYNWTLALDKAGLR